MVGFPLIDRSLVGMLLLSLLFHCSLFLMVSTWGRWGKAKVTAPIMIDLVSDSAPSEPPAGKVAPKSPQVQERPSAMQVPAEEPAEEKIIEGETPDTTERLRSSIAEIERRVGREGRSVSLEEAYHAELYRHMKRFWHLPDEMVAEAKERGFQTEVWVRWRRDGVVLSYQIEKGSGNTAFDESVTRAIRSASPLPSIPPGLSGKEKEIGFRFSAQDY